MFNILKEFILNLTELIKNIPLRSLYITLSVQVFVAFLVFLAFGVLPVRKEAASFLSSKNSKDCPMLAKTQSGLVDTILRLNHYRAILDNQLKLAKEDSIVMIIDLHDSLVKLSFKGIDLFSTKIASIDRNEGLRKMPLFLLDSLFSGPFLIESEYASIEKFPIVVKKAPKDTIEAEQLSRAPVLPKQSDVFILFRAGDRFLIEVKQSEDELIGEKANFRKYKTEKRKILRTHSHQYLKGNSDLPYLYRLSVSIPREDARSIYRALPVKPVVLIRY